MRALKLFILFYLFLSPLSQAKESTDMTCSRKFISANYLNKKFENIYTCYINSNSQMPNWHQILEAQQKAYYQEYKLDSFFGLSFFLRENQSLKTSLPLKSKDQIISLEALALAKLCQYEKANDLINQYWDELKALKNNKISKVKSLISLQGAPKISEHKSSSSRPQWKLSPSQFAHLNHPKNLKRLIKNLCLDNQSGAENAH